MNLTFMNLWFKVMVKNGWKTNLKRKRLIDQKLAY